MRKTLYDYFIKIAPEDYNYYEHLSLKLELTQFSNQGNIEFIRSYFKFGNKSCVYKDFNECYVGETEIRASHSVSIYLIGLYICQQSEDLKMAIKNQLSAVGEMSFKYAWFLLCLYHDSAIYAERKIEKTDIAKKEQFVSTQLGSLNKYLEYPYTKSSILSYYKFRASEEYNDHGIYAGCLFYKRMSENIHNIIKQARQDATYQNIDFDKNNFRYNNLHWSSKHKNWHAFIASLIVKHNIWFRNIDKHSMMDVKEYVAHNISSFIIDNNSRFSYKTNPLLFLFCIIDTIEPIKLLNKYTKQNIDTLKRIGITIDKANNGMQLYITISERDRQCVFDNIKRRAINLEEWMNVKVDISKNDSVVIMWTTI